MKKKDAKICYVISILFLLLLQLLPAKELHAQVYPLPVKELEQVVSNWLERSGLKIVGKKIKRVEDAIVLTAPAVNSINTFEETEFVSPKEFKDYKKTSDNSLHVDLPGKSLIAITIK